MLNGTFAVSTGSIGDGDGEGCHGGDHGATIARSVATLSDSASVTGKVVFTTITHADGSTDQVLRVRISGAEAGATLDVSIDGTSIGSVTADDSGNAYAIFSTNPKTSNVGQLPSGLSSTPTSISIGTTITGTFSAATWGGPSSLAALGGRLLAHRR